MKKAIADWLSGRLCVEELEKIVVVLLLRRSELMMMDCCGVRVVVMLWM
jgi:hypothetical protein